MRKHGTTDQDVVIVQNQAIEVDRNSLAKQASGQRFDLIRRNFPELHESCGRVPAMIEDSVLSAPALRLDKSIGDIPADQPRKLGIAHGRMSAQRHQKVESLDARAELALQDAEQQRHRHGAGAVRNQDQHSQPVYGKSSETARGDRFDLLRRQKPVVQPVAGDR